MSWLLNFAYGLFLLFVSPVLLYRIVWLGKYRDGWPEKLLGLVPRRMGTRPCVWFHAVSVGEVLQLETILQGFRSSRPDVEIVVTATTPTGLAVARDKYPDVLACYFPLDFSWAVARAMKRLRPSAIVLVELELWPNFILAANRHGIPLALINGRISQKSSEGYQKIRLLMRHLLWRFDLLAVQNKLYGDRLLALGAPEEKIVVTGSIKFDRAALDSSHPLTEELRRSFAILPNERVFVAGSTQAPEEELALDAWLKIRNEFPDLRLILVPRHKERFEQVAALVTSRGLPLIRRSSTLEEKTSPTKGGEAATPNSNLCPKDPPPVLLLDTLGELSACWRLAEFAFVGGSLTRRGGQNMIEPAACGATVMFGPNTWNFKDVVEILLAADAATVVHDGEEMTERLRKYLSDPTLSRRRGEAARQLVLTQRGATEKTLQRILDLIPAASTTKHPVKAA